jgi:Na+-driven multidrug efflux pump
LAIITALFAIGAIFGNSKHPYGVFFKKFVRPRLAAPQELEDPRPPQFAQLIGFIVAAVGLVLGAFGVTYGVAGAAAAAFIAAFLNAAFAFCLGCQIYVGLQRIGLIKQH